MVNRTRPYHGKDLSFGGANTKLKEMAAKIGIDPRTVYAFDLRAGVTCPFAKECKSTVTKGGIKDGKHCKFRCYAASNEQRLPVVFNLRERNTKAIKKACKGGSPLKIAQLILANLPPNVRVIRLHTSGDFFCYTYFLGWMLVAKMRPDITFYFYTKALPFLKRYLKERHKHGVSLSKGKLAKNVRVTASYGGTHDHLIKELGIRYSKVILAESDKGRLPIDKDDTHAYKAGGSFCLMVHGVQPAGTEAAKVWHKEINRRAKNVTR
jgi:hypothetical protein